MGTRYYKFFAIMRQAISNKQLEFSASGNKIVYKMLNLLRINGLIGGFCLQTTNWNEYPKYKVFLKYNYFGFPVIKKIDCFKLTRTNYTNNKRLKPKINLNNYWIISCNSGIELVNNIEKKNSKLLARIKV